MITSEQFPKLLAAARSAERTSNAIAALASGIEAGSIRKVVLDDAKFILNSDVKSVWEAHVSSVYSWGQKYKNLTEQEQELDDSLHVWGLYEVVSVDKKLAKSSVTGPMVDAMRAVVAELLPLAMAVSSLKDKVIKGRAPNTAPAKPVNPNKLVQTCPCCFRAIAVVQGTMAHHGYRRPLSGYQTASCPGVRFPQLEVSNSGLVWLIGAIRKELEQTRNAYANRDKKKSLMFIRNRKQVEYTQESPEWNEKFRSFVMGLQREIEAMEAELVVLDQKLANWAPAALQ